MNPIKKVLNAIRPKTKQFEHAMNDSKAHIYNLIIVDESGSMRPLKKATLSGINETINTIRSAQEAFVETQHHTLTLVTFDSDHGKQPVRTIINNRPIAEVKEFSVVKKTTQLNGPHPPFKPSSPNSKRKAGHSPTWEPPTM